MNQILYKKSLNIDFNQKVNKLKMYPKLFLKSIKDILYSSIIIYKALVEIIFEINKNNEVIKKIKKRRVIATTSLCRFSSINPLVDSILT